MGLVAAVALGVVFSNDIFVPTSRERIGDPTEAGTGEELVRSAAEVPWVLESVVDPARASPPAPPPASPVPSFPGVVLGPSGAEEPVSYLPDLPPEAVEIAATGDVNLGGPLTGTIAAQPDYPWRRVSGILRRADVAMVNLECAVSERGTPYPKQFTFRADPRSLPAMKDAGVDVASVANNHSLDFGTEAFADTISGLLATGIAPIGGGATEQEAWQPHVVTVEGVRFAFVAASRVIPHESWAVGAGGPGVASAYGETRLLREVKRAKAAADGVVVTVHWGLEGRTMPEPYQVSLAHRLVEAGASVVIGHHPHVLQPVVRYRGAIIAYSLGNFVFTSRVKVQRSMVLRIGVLPGGELVAARVPIAIVGGQPRPA